jgi:lysylphosphatidylglycerol synthetase-like protein (DUF2156 family)
MTFCPSCGKPVADNAIFCPSCGYSLQAKPQVAQQPPTSASPQFVAGAGRRTSRPVGVTIIAVLDALLGLLMLLSGGAILGVGTFMGTFGGPMSAVHGLVTGFGVLVFVVGFVTIFLALGIWTGASWAWTAALVIAILSAVLHLLSFNLLLLAINVIVIVYLLQPNVKLYFRR